MLRKNFVLKNITIIGVFVSFSFIISLLSIGSLHASGGYDLSKSSSHFKPVSNVLDTFPLEDRYGDFINDKSYNPFDITPSSVTQEVEYDPATDRYIILEKIGDEYYRTPSYMTFDEYMDYRAQQQESQYFNRLAGINTGIKSGSGKVDPMSKIDIKNNLIDRLFGGSEVTIQPQGNIDITTGIDYQNVQNPAIQLSQQRQGPFFDFDMDIRMNVEGSIGKKLNLGFNYDTQATFDFDRKIKLEYDTEAFSEDDIIKSIEAGNVSLPLNSQLIQGSQSLFGLKADLQFGKLRLSLLASQQRSKQNELTIESGSLVQEYEIRPEEYDENRHFFLTHYHRQKYEAALNDLPYIDSQMKITNIQVWITNDTDRNVERSTKVCAFADIAKSDLDIYEDPGSLFPPKPIFTAQETDVDGDVLPDNDNNPLYEELLGDDVARVESMTATSLTSGKFGLRQTRDFEIFRGRLLTQNEFSFNPELGFISLNVRLRQDQVLAVAFEYNYSINGDKVYQVGELANDAITDSQDESGEPEPESVIYLKMLKSTSQRTSLPSWDLMMKNVYPLGTAQLSAEDFKFDIFFEDNTEGALVRFIPEEEVRVSPLLNLFGLDRLNSRLDPQEDGIFDFVPGVTIIPSNGSIIFPKLEPFGSFLVDTLVKKGVDPNIAANYGFSELYDSTVVKARESLEKNRFVMVGQFKSSISSEISLGSFNIPQNSVTVRAGSDILQEGVDYEIDYGLGRLKIINPSYLQAGTPIRVSFEDQSLFSLQQKTMLGVRADYQFNEKFNVGGTFLRLFERPFTEKVNIGDDPINNKIYGLDFTYSSESEFITKLVDKLPFYGSNEISNINLTGEFAALRPGHSGAINLNGAEDVGGVVSIDDFEGSGSSIPLGNQPNNWVLASCPQDFGNPGSRPEGGFTNDLAYGANRAKLNWYTIDPRARSAADNTDPYTRLINQDELFDREIPLDQLPDLFTFDLTYYPTERGPYNFDIEGGRMDTSGSVMVSAGVEVNTAEQRVELLEPQTRWGGIMRNIDNNDFQAANVEYIEFWMLNPFMDRRGETASHREGESGKLYFHLGNVSEDILRDNLQMYENSIPLDPNVPTPLESSAWSEVPLTTPTIIGFPNNTADIDKQDIGYDGVDDFGETQKFNEYLASFSTTLPPSVQQDPANDNFVYFEDPSLNTDNLLERYRGFNGPQGNAPDGQSNERGNPRPDIEDLNNNRSLDQGESYYEYELNFVNNGGQINPDSTSFLREVRPVAAAGSGQEELWYRFQIPVQQGTAVNGIEGFRSIQFMRMYMTGFESQKTLRMAEFELVRNQWRTQQPTCILPGVDGGVVDADSMEFSIDAVGIQENNSKIPFNYLLPRGIQQQQLFSTFNNVLQDERSLVLNFCNLEPRCQATVFKWSNVDLRVFERLQMFVHAEQRTGETDWDNGEVTAFIRIGRDFVNNYYEYEIPLTLSDPDLGQTQENIWPDVNQFDFPLELLTDIKQQRNLAGTLVSQEFIANDPDKPNNSVKIKGNPSLGYIKGIQIGVRGDTTSLGDSYCGEIWVNELRATGLDERGGMAGIARMDIQLADLGTVSASGGFSTIGFGGLDQKLDDRQKEAKTNYDVATNLNLDKFFPAGWNMSIPFFAQYSKSVSKPQFDPFELDLSVEETVASRAANDPDKAAEIRARANDVTTIKTFNLTNVKKNRGSAGPRAPEKFDPQNPPKAKKKSTPKPWDIENFAASYAYTKIDHRDPLLAVDRTTDIKGGLDYNYSRKAKFFKPFKSIKGSWLKWLSDFNFNPLPNTLTVNTQLRRIKNQRQYRLPDVPVFAFDDIRFDWNRQYSLRWDLAKSLKLNFSATNTSIVDELRQVGIPDENSPDPTDPNTRKWVNELGDTLDVASGRNYSDIINDNPDFVRDYRRENLKSGGRNKAYQHNLDVAYTLPFSLIKPLSWITAKAQYQGGYTWAVAPLNLADVGNTIQNNQNRSLNTTFNFEKLYDNIGYLKKVQGKKTRSRRKKNKKQSLGDKNQVKKGDDPKEDRKKERGEREISVAEKVLIRPLLSLRSIKFNLKQDYNTVVPGFNPVNEYLGLSSGFDAPGLGFVAGLQPNLEYTPSTRDNWLYQAADNGWISSSERLNTQVSQSKSINWDARIEIEPFKDFNIDVDFKKSYREDHTENFRFLDTDPDPSNPNIQGSNFNQLARFDVGSFEVSYLALNTLFGTDAFDLVDQFRANRIDISQRLENKVNAGTFENNPNSPYAEGFGPWSNEVAIPAFLAAYTGTDITQVSDSDLNEDLQTKVKSNTYIPAPNWKLNYRGLSKLDMFKDIFTSFDLTHGYKSSLRVARFFSDQEYQLDPFDQDQRLFGLNEASSNYFSRIEIPQLVIDEQFSPLLGLRMKTKNNINIDIEYRKGRNLELITQAKTINENRNTEITLGFGYTIQNVNIGFLTGDKGKKTRKKRGSAEETETPDPRNTGRGSVNRVRGRELTLNVDFSLRDDVTYRHNVNEIGRAEPYRGTKSIRLSPSVNYEVDKNLTIRTFVDYSKQIPYITTSFPVTSIQGGITVRFNLN